MGHDYKDGMLDIYVEDTRLRIEKMNLLKIFERFKKLNAFI
ncbi:hypothetical protein [Bacteroides oleiciplenus]